MIVFFKSWDSTLPFQIQWYRWYDMGGLRKPWGVIREVRALIVRRPLGPVWTHIEALGRVFGHFCLWGIYMRYDYYSVTFIEIQWYRYGLQTVIEIQWYIYEIQTVIEIQRYSDTDMRYRWDTGLWAPSEYTQRLCCRVLGRFCPLGTSLCMYRYDEIWDSISLSIRCSSGAWCYPDSTSLPVRWGPDMMRLFP